MSILEVRDLTVSFRGERSTVRAVNGLSYSVDRGRTLGIVGESGSGKTVASLALMRLLRGKSVSIDSGAVFLAGENLFEKNEREMRRIRGRRIAMVFQDPMTSLNPVLSVGEQIAESVRLHFGVSHKAAFDRAITMLETVHIPSARKRAHEFPHEFSGGMRQRVMIAMALACEPEVLIADEPTTALDVTIQAQILALIKELQEKFGTAVVLITHDLAVVAETCDSVLVMYAGQAVEYAEVTSLFAHPGMPYTQGLLRSVPRLTDLTTEPLVSIPGQPPNPASLPAGCAFRPRCTYAIDACEAPQTLQPRVPSGVVRCIRYGEIAS